MHEAVQALERVNVRLGPASRVREDMEHADGTGRIGGRGVHGQEDLRVDAGQRDEP